MKIAINNEGGDVEKGKEMSLMQVIQNGVREQEEAWQEAYDLADALVEKTENTPEGNNAFLLRNRLREEHPELEPRKVTLAVERALRNRSRN